MVSILACHVRDPGSIPGRGVRHLSISRLFFRGRISRKEGKDSLQEEPDSNQRFNALPKKIYIPPLYQLSYRGVVMCVERHSLFSIGVSGSSPVTIYGDREIKDVFVKNRGRISRKAGGLSPSRQRTHDLSFNEIAHKSDFGHTFRICACGAKLDSIGWKKRIRSSPNVKLEPTTERSRVSFSRIDGGYLEKRERISPV